MRRLNQRSVSLIVAIAALLVLSALAPALSSPQINPRPAGREGGKPRQDSGKSTNSQGTEDGPGHARDPKTPGTWPGAGGCVGRLADGLLPTGRELQR